MPDKRNSDRLVDLLQAAVVTVRGAKSEQEERKFQVDDLVKVVRPLAALEKGLVGRVFKFRGYTVPHGYAKCEDGRGAVFLHPDALEKFTQP